LLKKLVYLENLEEEGAVKRIQEVADREVEDVVEAKTEEMTHAITVKSLDILREIVENKHVIVLEQMVGALSVMKEGTKR
jgi:hypothetical protein